MFGTILLVWLGFGLLGAWVAQRRGRSGCGFFALGLFLGPIGVIIAALFSKTPEKVIADGLESGELAPCPECREPVRHGATTCPHCRTPVKWG